MKKLICLLLILCLFPVIALADVDLSSMSFDELVQLSQSVTMEIMSRPEWKEVTVPSGSWYVGKDIPAGDYSVYPTSKGGYIRVLNENGKTLITQGLRKETDIFGKLELKDGYTVQIEDGSLIFRPAVGLGF